MWPHSSRSYGMKFLSKKCTSFSFWDWFYLELSILDVCTLKSSCVSRTKLWNHCNDSGFVLIDIKKQDLKNFSSLVVLLSKGNIVLGLIPRSQFQAFREVGPLVAWNVRETPSRFWGVFIPQHLRWLSGLKMAFISKLLYTFQKLDMFLCQIFLFYDHMVLWII